MIRIEFNGETIGDTASETMTLQAPLRFSAGGASEIVELVAADFVEAFSRGNKSMTVSFTVMHEYGSIAEASIALAERDRDMEQQATLDYIVDDGSEVVTLRMKNAVRKPVDGIANGVCIVWQYSFTGARFVRVESAATVADYDGGFADSGTPYDGFYWGGVCGDGLAVSGNWQRQLVGDTY